MDVRIRKRDPWIVTSLRNRGMRLYRATLINSHSFTKQTLMLPAKSNEDATKTLVNRLGRLNKRQLDGSFWFACKTVAI